MNTNQKTITIAIIGIIFLVPTLQYVNAAKFEFELIPQNSTSNYPGEKNYNIEKFMIVNSKYVKADQRTISISDAYDSSIGPTIKISPTEITLMGKVFYNINKTETLVRDIYIHLNINQIHKEPGIMPSDSFNLMYGTGNGYIGKPDFLAQINGFARINANNTGTLFIGTDGTNETEIPES